MYKKETINLGNASLEYYRLIDETFIATWDEKDGKKIDFVTSAARNNILPENRAHKYFTSIEKTIKDKWNDHHTLRKHPDPYLTYEPLEVSYKYDGVTDYGLSLFLGLIVGKSLPPISHMAAGDGVGDTVDYQDILVSERARYAFNEHGFMGALNNDLRFSMTFDIALPTFTVKEIGLFNNGTDNTGPLIARTTFDPGVVHTQSQNYVTVNYLMSVLSS